MDAAGLEHRLSDGECVWHWLRESLQWDQFTLLFISLHREGDSVVAGLWEVWDDGSGVEDPVMFRPAAPDGECGRPNHRLFFPDVAAALAELAVHNVTADGFQDHGALVSAYSQAVLARPPRRP